MNWCFEAESWLFFRICMSAAIDSYKRYQYHYAAAPLHRLVNLHRDIACQEPLKRLAHVLSVTKHQ